MLVKLSPGVNFTIVTFMLTDPKSTKKTVKQLFALLGPLRVKAARKHVDEIDTCSHTHNHWLVGVCQI